MNDSDFLAEILANPHDDVPRLVYADWLEEQGHPRGEFIRIQCELAAGVEGEERRIDLQVRERDLLDEFDEEWAGTVPSLVTRHVFLRGFVEYVVMAMQEFSDRAEELFQLAPIRHAMLNCRRSADTVALAECLQLEQLNGLVLSGVDDTGIKRIFRNRSFFQLERLILSQNRLHDSSVEALAECPSLINLKVLDLSHNALRNLSAITLAETPYIQKLESLLLSHNEIRLIGANALAESSNFDQLKHLDFRRNPSSQRIVEILRQRFGVKNCEV